PSVSSLSPCTGVAADASLRDDGTSRMAGRSGARDGPRGRGAGQLATFLNGRSIIELILPDAKGAGQPVCRNRRDQAARPASASGHGMIRLSRARALSPDDL